MTNKTCPRCDCTRLEYEENYGYWECLDCGHVWALDADDPDYDEEPLDLGACCGCGTTNNSLVRNILTLHKKALVAGTGWECFICGIPANGAIAVVCDDCLAQLEEGKEVLKQAVYGDVLDKQRCDIAQLTEDFDHKNIPHE
ncbi:hypothetical protein A6769_22095 [Nostoc punctiforme NIES-2108]|uniref:Uncharacterized protein n=1 Tax=Nostoc punctiforme NIES-2108 TaxID=1356359 RepID=A0A367RG02_NOSPU|nr:hypothetical protein A6769_22095 [Nostoc punctiforme NIES-2108]